MTDARIVRTRAALHKAVLELAEQKPVSAIAVSELADLAEINRVTFYKHYSTPGEALTEALSTLLAATGQCGGEDFSAEADPFMACLYTALDHIDEHREVYTIAFNDSIDGTVPMMLSRHLAVVAHTYLVKRRKRKPSIPDIDLDVAAAFLASGAMGAIQVWTLEGDMSRERFVENMEHFLPAWFYAEES